MGDYRAAAMANLKPEIPMRAAQVAVLSLSFTAGGGCTRDPADGTNGGADSGDSGSSDGLAAAIEERTRLECECYVDNGYYSYYDSVEECVEQRSLYGIPEYQACIQMELEKTGKGREALGCVTDVIEDFNICAKERGCSEEYYYGGIARRCQLEAELGYYDCIDAAGGYEAWYDIFSSLYYTCYEDGWYGGGGSSGGGYGGGTFTCTNGEQIPLDYRCDEEPDCEDASDELDCEPFTCGDGSQIPANWACDGEADCADESDEAACMSVPAPRPRFKPFGRLLHVDAAASPPPVVETGEN